MELVALAKKVRGKYILTYRFIAYLGMGYIICARIQYLCAFSRKIIYPECSVSDNLNIIINVWSWKGHEGTH